jgi:anti-sigma regulatory factor (Ser/Thr protein kinase)
LLGADGGCVALRMTLLSSTVSVPVIRALVQRVTDVWGYGTQLIDDAELVASELTANAVLHGQAEGCACFDVRLRPGYQHLRIEVADTGPSLPRQKTPGSVAETGRGLLLVEAVSQRWGVVRETPAGKTVWAELATDSS